MQEANAEAGQPVISRITLYPIKSFDGVDVSRAELLSSGALAWDRRYALVDSQGRLVNGKRLPALHRIRAKFDLDERLVALRRDGEAAGPAVFHLDEEQTALCEWIGDALGFRVLLIENRITGHPDDLEAPGPTVVATASLREVAGWFADQGLDLDEVRRRFRANIEVDSAPPFWEDGFVASHPDAVVPLSLGTAALLGVNPCQRCAVPPRNSLTGETLPGFAKRFESRREQTLPAWSPRERFNHFYRLTLNTRPATGEPATLRLGDPAGAPARSPGGAG